MSGRGSFPSAPYQTHTGGSDARGSSRRRLRALSVAATVCVYLVIALGGVVRATGSGDACPDWPTCYGRVVPPLGDLPAGVGPANVLIEYSHRLLASVAVILIGVLAVHAWRRYRRDPRVLGPAIAAVVLVFVQAALGGIVVTGGLHALLVTAHFATAMVLLAVLVHLVVAAWSPGPRRAGRDGLARLAVVTAGLVLVLLLLGAYVRGAGAGLAFSDWPLMDGRLIPALGTEERALHFAHRALAVVTGLLVLRLVLAARRDRARRPGAAMLALVAAAVFGVQVAVGAANVWTELAPPAVAAHVALAALVWGAVVATASAAGAGEGAATREPAPAEREEVPA